MERSPSSGAGEFERVVARLEEAIIFGRLKPRERLVEEELAVRLVTKRHIVRDALIRLERMGIVQRTRNKGAVVRDFAPEEVAHIYEMRELLQEAAARRIPLPAEPGLLAALRRIHAAHGAAAEAGDLRAVYRHNNAFHDTLFAACGNPYLVRAIAEHAWLAHAIRSYRIADRALLAQAREEHAAMIEALAAGDRERLVALCVEHIKPSLRAYLAQPGLVAVA
jgi:DNA-binding GntR family transcriptional regulator